MFFKIKTPDCLDKWTPYHFFLSLIFAGVSYWSLKISLILFALITLYELIATPVRLLYEKHKDNLIDKKKFKMTTSKEFNIYTYSQAECQKYAIGATVQTNKRKEPCLVIKKFPYKRKLVCVARVPKNIIYRFIEYWLDPGGLSTNDLTANTSAFFMGLFLVELIRVII